MPPSALLVQHATLALPAGKQPLDNETQAAPEGVGDSKWEEEEKATDPSASCRSLPSARRGSERAKVVLKRASASESALAALRPHPRLRKDAFGPLQAGTMPPAAGKPSLRPFASAGLGELGRLAS